MADHLEHALSDLKVLDFTRAAAGPSCTRMLVEMGAEVIKVESAPSGDMVRGMKMCTFRNNRSLYFVQQNRGKKSLCLDLKDPRGMALVAELVPHVDIVVENFRPGVMDKFGLGYSRLQEMKSDIVLCSITAFGQKGPLASSPGYDFIAQAYSGITSMIGEPNEAPCLPQAAIGDISTGVHGALAIVSAIHHRNRTGRGEHIDIALLDVYYHYHDANVHVYSASEGRLAPTRSGRHYEFLAPCGVFKGTGGFLVVMGFLHHWPDLCKAIVLVDLIEHPDFCDDTSRIKNRPELINMIESWLSQFSDVESAIRHLQSFDVPCAPVLSVAETIDHPHLRERGTVRTIEDPIHGSVEMPGMPIKWKHLPNDLDLEAPTLGQHNEELLTRVLGRTSEDISSLRNAGVLVEHNS